MREQWFRSIYRTDPAWHRSARGPVAVCGALADPSLPWVPRVPAGQGMCADCEP